MRKFVVVLALLLFTTAICAQDAKLSNDQRDLVETERAFARYCVENGIRAAWLEYFADDGIIFQPGPINSKAFYTQRPPQAKPFRGSLNWEPRWGDISSAGDLGYNIGPWTYTDNTSGREPDAHGYFMSVWRKQPDGKWKVALDFGSGPVTSATADHVFGQPFRAVASYKSKILTSGTQKTDLQELFDIEKAVARNEHNRAAVDSYVSQLADTVSVMRAGSAPSGKNLVSSYIPAGRNVSLTFTPAGGGVASSREFGYTYGSYELSQAGQSKEKGYYAHVWKRDPNGRWRIVVSNLEQEKAN